MPEYKYNSEELERSLRLYRKGLSCEVVEKITGVHEATVRRVARQQGAIRPRNYTRLTDKEQKEIVRLYCREKNSRRQIEKQTGINQHVAYRFLKKNGLIRSPGEAISIAMKGKKRGPYSIRKNKPH